MPANGNLVPWKRGDAPLAEHLNQAWDRLRQIGGIEGADQLGHGTAIPPNVSFTYAGQFDAIVQLHSNQKTSNPCYANFDYPDPRYQVQAVHQNQKATTPQEGFTVAQSDDPLSIQLSLFPGGLPPDKIIMAWNLWENEWNSHYILPGEIVTVHIIRTCLNASNADNPDITWYVFNKAPKVIRKGTVVNQDIKDTPTDCDNIVYVWDQKELVKPEECREITKVTLSSAALAGAWDLDEFDVISYIPTVPLIASTVYIPSLTPDVFWTGDVVAWLPVQHVGIFGCNGETLADIAPVGAIQFYRNDFLVTQADLHGTGCYDTARVAWRGFDVTQPYVEGVTDSPCCGVKELRFDAFDNTEASYKSVKVNFLAECDTDQHDSCRCPDGGTETIGRAKISAMVDIPTKVICVPFCVTQDSDTKVLTVTYKNITVLDVGDCSVSCSYSPPCEKTVYPLTNCSTDETIYTSTDESALIGKVVDIAGTCYTVGESTSVSCSASSPAMTVTASHDSCEECTSSMIWHYLRCNDSVDFYTDFDLTGYDAFTDGTFCYSIVGLVANTGQSQTTPTVVYAYLSCMDCNSGSSSSSSSSSGSGGCTETVYGMQNCITSITTYTTTNLALYVFTGRTILVDGACYTPSGPFTVACAEEGTYPPVTVDADYANCPDCNAGL